MQAYRSERPYGAHHLNPASRQVTAAAASLPIGLISNKKRSLSRAVATRHQAFSKPNKSWCYLEHRLIIARPLILSHEHALQRAEELLELLLWPKVVHKIGPYLFMAPTSSYCR